MINRNVTISIPVELYNKAKYTRINVSAAAVIGIRINLGLSCPIEGGCKCSLKSQRLQGLLLNAQSIIDQEREKFERLKKYARGMVNKYVLEKEDGKERFERDVQR